jgi:hypothetical protein
MTLGTHTPTTWNDILSTTMHNYRKTLTDNIFNSRPLLNYLMSNGRVRKAGGGISIVEPIIYNRGDTDSYAEWDTVTVNPVNTATAAQYDWKQLYATIAISGLEEAQNNGKEAIVNLLEAKIMQAEDSLKEMLNGMLFGTKDALGYPAASANDFLSFITLVDDTAAAGGIDPATEAWWKSIVTAVGAVDAAGLEAAMRTAYNSASDSGNDRVDSMFTDDATFGFYESTLTPQVRYTDTKKANLGFQNLMFKNVPIFWDFQCPAGVMLGLNSKYVGLCIHSDRDFKQSPFTDNLSGSLGAPASGAGIGAASGNALDARMSFITTYGNATIRNRRRCFKLTGIAEA